MIKETLNLFCWVKYLKVSIKRARDIYSRNGIKKCGMMVIYLKIIFITIVPDKKNFSLINEFF